MKRLGVIGGTGLQNLDFPDVSRRDSLVVETPFGDVPLTCISMSNNTEVIFLQRHHGCGNKPPHAINHHANMRALFDSGVDGILAVCSVGAIAKDFVPGNIGYAEQYIDFTGVETTYHDEDAVFTSMTQPFDKTMNRKIVEILGESRGLTYWLAHGPQFETPKEIDAIESLGGDVVGMTMPREVKLAAELGVPYAAILVSSNWAAGRDPTQPDADLNHEEVSTRANKNLSPVMSCILSFLQNDD